jgi:hypothetical protein
LGWKPHINKGVNCKKSHFEWNKFLTDTAG